LIEAEAGLYKLQYNDNSFYSFPTLICNLSLIAFKPTLDKNSLENILIPLPVLNMASITPGAAEPNVFEDLSGNPISHTTNPYDSLIESCQNDPVSHLHLISPPHLPNPPQKQIQARYETHRTARNSQQKAKLLSPSFSGFSIDPVLHKLVRKAQYPDFEDERNCLVFWARPPQPLKALISTIQQRLLDVAPSKLYALSRPNEIADLPSQTSGSCPPTIST